LTRHLVTERFRLQKFVKVTRQVGMTVGRKAYLVSLILHFFHNVYEKYR
jgi:hypothetical protein